MSTMKIRNRADARAIGWRILLTTLAISASLVALLLGGGIAVLLAGKFGHAGTYAVWETIGLSGLVLLLLLRQNELATVLILAVHLYVDFYMGFYVAAQVLALVVLAICYLTRSPLSNWGGPRSLGLWILFLGLCLLPAIRGAIDLEDTFLYYPNVILGALIMFWLGNVIIHNRASLRLFWILLSAFSTLIAIHTIIQELTGITLFSSTVQETFLASISNYQLGTSGVHRVGSFFSDPDYNGAFLSMMLFLPLGLLAESSTLPQKGLYLTETLLILLALLFTYSGTAWIGALSGLIIYLILVGDTRSRFLPSLGILGGTIILLTFFPNQVQLLLQHVTGNGEIARRVAIWQASLGVILAFPLTGIGLSHILFFQIASHYAVAARYAPIDHPHDAYLEFAAMAGIPVLLTFVALMARTLWQALAHWRRADRHTRSLIGAGIAAAIALCTCSLATNAWTLPPLAAVGWLILGAVTSPLLTKTLSQVKTP